MSESQAALSKAQVGARPALRRARPARWPLYLTVLGALAASLALWAGIFVAFDLAADLLGGPPKG